MFEFIPKVATTFDRWVKKKKFPLQRGQDQRYLLKWISEGNGLEYINNYDHFKELVSVLSRRGYCIHPLPQKAEFDDLVSATLPKKKAAALAKTEALSQKGKGKDVPPASSKAPALPGKPSEGKTASLNNEKPKAKPLYASSVAGYFRSIRKTEAKAYADGARVKNRKKSNPNYVRSSVTAFFRALTKVETGKPVNDFGSPLPSFVVAYFRTFGIMEAKDFAKSSARVKNREMPSQRHVRASVAAYFRDESKITNPKKRGRPPILKDNSASNSAPDASKETIALPKKRGRPPKIRLASDTSKETIVSHKKLLFIPVDKDRPFPISVTEFFKANKNLFTSPMKRGRHRLVPAPAKGVLSQSPQIAAPVVT